jgi:hypothetical protein
MPYQKQIIKTKKGIALKCFICSAMIEKSEKDVTPVYKLLDKHYIDTHKISIAEWRKQNPIAKLNAE